MISGQALVEVARGEVGAVPVDLLAELQIHWDDLDAELPSQLARKIGGAVSNDGDQRHSLRTL